MRNKKTLILLSTLISLSACSQADLSVPNNYEVHDSSDSTERDADINKMTRYFANSYDEAIKKGCLFEGRCSFDEFSIQSYISNVGGTNIESSYTLYRVTDFSCDFKFCLNAFTPGKKDIESYLRFKNLNFTLEATSGITNKQIKAKDLELFVYRNNDDIYVDTYDKDFKKFYESYYDLDPSIELSESEVSKLLGRKHYEGIAEATYKKLFRFSSSDIDFSTAGLNSTGISQKEYIFSRVASCLMNYGGDTALSTASDRYSNGCAMSIKLSKDNHSSSKECNLSGDLEAVVVFNSSGTRIREGAYGSLMFSKETIVGSFSSIEQAINVNLKNIDCSLNCTYGTEPIGFPNLSLFVDSSSSIFEEMVDLVYSFDLTI